MTFALVGGTTETASIPGISAAGGNPELMAVTPTADVEIVERGEPISTDAIPVSPTGCPTPALLTRAVRDLVDLDLAVIDAGMARPPAIETTVVADQPGGDIRSAMPVPEAEDIWERARTVGRDLSAPLTIGETIPGGTTTALGVCRALGVDIGVSSSLPENPLERKHRIVSGGLDASDLSPGDLAGAPREALRYQGDPVLAGVAGLAEGALSTGASVTLAGGTQMLAVVALLDHAGVEDSIEVATTRYVADDPATDIHRVGERFDVRVTVTDPEFEQCDHLALARFANGEGKEGVGMGGAIAIAQERGHSMKAVRETAIQRYETVPTARVDTPSEGR